MRKLVALAGLAGILVFSLASAPAAADETEVRYVITNGGVDVEGKGQVHFSPVGRHDQSIAWSGSGNPVRLPEGSYDVHVTFDDGDAHKEFWIDNQSFAGKVEKTVEVALPVTSVRYVITNGGVDTEGKGQVHYSPAGRHDQSVAWSSSDGTVRMPEGSYDVHVTYDDGDAHKEFWMDGQNFSGNVEKTVEVALPITSVRYVITNGGVDTEGKGQVHYSPAGRHDQSVAWSSSGGTVRMPEGSYDVHVTFDDGDARKEFWIDGQSFSGKVEKTVEIGLPVTSVQYVITNAGVDTEGKGQVHYSPVGKHDQSVAWSSSGGTVRLPEGSYDVRVTFNDGDAHKEKWILNQTFSGKVERTVEIGQAVAEVHYLITNDGADVGQKGQTHYFPAGKHDSPISWTSSGETVRLTEGDYDVQVLFTDGIAHKELWLNNQNLADKVDQTVELGITLAQPTVTVMQNGADVGSKARVTYYRPSSTQEVGEVNSGEQTVAEAGTYDIRASLDGAEGWLRAASVTGAPHLTIDVTPVVARQPSPPPFALTTPAAEPEQVTAEKGDFPYLAPVPGSVLTGGKASTGSVYVQLPDARQPDLVANASVIKSYRPPAGISVAQLLSIYHQALLNAGWTIVNELHRIDAIITTHYGQNGRNIWAFIHMDNNGYSITVADATIVLSRLAADLGSNCHLALTGVLFDFDKSTLKPESDAVLKQVSAIMTNDATLRLEVQGHTDSVGSDGYNQPLSEARARAVMTWLTQHGVSADRLLARGYGKTRPVASNATDEGRARNRRVEIANQACKVKG